MKLYDATLPMEEGMVTFPGDPVFQVTPISSLHKGDAFDLSRLALGTHQGTHVDSPKHYLECGAGADALPLDALVGPGVVLDMRGRARIDREALEQVSPGRHKRVFLKTDSGLLLRERTFREDYVHLTETGAAFLIEQGVTLVGIDYLSIERYGNPGAPVHRALLQAGIVIVEGACLVEVPPGTYEVLCLPLRIKDADGSPARLILSG